jgi:NAD(P)-dependent dehydrogenase (short-subunit alcohol dehydrogenase family)
MSDVSFDLKDKVAVVTGGSRGIGEAIAILFAKHGAKVVLASRKIEGLQEVAAKITEAGGEALPIACHAGKSDQIAALFDQVKEKYGRVDILVNNAATNPYFGPAVHTPEAAFDKTIEVNIKGYFLFMQHAAQAMVEQGNGSIINIASIAGIRPGAMQMTYAMTKAAVISMTKGFANEIAAAGVRVNAIAPGLVETKFAATLIDTPEIYEHAMAGTPMKRHGQPNEIAGAALYLASDAGAFCTGSVMTIDGGATS